MIKIVCFSLCLYLIGPFSARAPLGNDVLRVESELPSIAERSASQPSLTRQQYPYAIKTTIVDNDLNTSIPSLNAADPLNAADHLQERKLSRNTSVLKDLVNFFQSDPSLSKSSSDESLKNAFLNLNHSDEPESTPLHPIPKEAITTHEDRAHQTNSPSKTKGDVPADPAPSFLEKFKKWHCCLLGAALPSCALIACVITCLVTRMDTASASDNVSNVIMYIDRTDTNLSYVALT